MLKQAYLLVIIVTPVTYEGIENLWMSAFSLLFSSPFNHFQIQRFFRDATPRTCLWPLLPVGVASFKFSATPGLPPLFF